MCFTTEKYIGNNNSPINLNVRLLVGQLVSLSNQKMVKKNNIIHQYFC